MGNIGKELRKEKNIMKIHCIKFPKSKSKFLKAQSFLKKSHFHINGGLGHIPRSNNLSYLAEAIS